ACLVPPPRRPLPRGPRRRRAPPPPPGRRRPPPPLPLPARALADDRGGDPAADAAGGRRRVAMVRAAVRRFCLLLAGAAALTVLASLFFGLLAGVAAGRSISVGFYLVGSFLLIGGFFMGNRGPLRLKREDQELPFVPFLGSRVVRWATPDEREEAINTSALYVALGLVLILLGVVADSRYHLF